MRLKIKDRIKRVQALPIWDNLGTDLKKYFGQKKWRLFRHLFFPLLAAIVLCGLQFVLYGTLLDMTTTNSIQPNPTNYYDNDFWTIEPTGWLWFFKHLSLTGLISVIALIINIYAGRLWRRLKRFSLRTTVNSWRA